MNRMQPQSFASGLLMIIVFLTSLSLWGFYSAIRPSKIVSNVTPKELGLTYEDVSFITGDGLALRGWFIPRQSSGQLQEKESVGAKTIVLLHGYPADKGDILPALSFLAQKYNLFFFDFRYLGQSEGGYSTAGAREVEDIGAALRYLRTRGIREVGVWGLSMGGAVALMAAPQSPEIRALVSESSYSRLDLMTLELYQLPLVRYPLGFLTNLWARVFLGINTRTISPADAARSLTIPVLIVHSKNDEVIPFSHAERIKDALRENPKAQFWFTESLVHGELGGEYQARIEEFFGTNL